MLMLRARSQEPTRRGGTTRAHWNRAAAGNVVVNRGLLADGGSLVEYYTSEPSPGQWIAVGVVPILTSLHVNQAEMTHRLLVGSGSTEDRAVDALRKRLSSVLPSSGSSPTVPTDLLVSDPQASDWFGD